MARPPLTVLRALALSFAALLVAALPACVGEDVDQDYQSQSAQLTLAIQPPPGVSVQLVLSGPDHFTRTLDSADAGTDADGGIVLTGLVPGSYSLEIPAVVVPTSLVDTVWADDAQEGTFTLAAGDQLEKVIDYSVRPGSGSLWLTQFGDASALGSWPVAALMAGENPAAPVQLLSSYSTLAGFALDSTGALWLLANDAQTSTFASFAAAQAVAGQSQPTPGVLQAGGRLDAFCLDASGGIFAASQVEQRLYHWSAATVASGNLLTPDVSLQGAAGALDAPIGLAFDATGSLWVVSAGTANTSGSVARFEPRQLAASGYYLPTVQLAVDSPGALAFDAQGDLWIVSSGSSLLEYTASQLGGADAAEPALTLSLDADESANSIAFDAIGDLWVSLQHASDSSSALVMFTPGQLAKTAQPAPFEALRTQPGRGGTSLLIVDPTPAALPLAGAPQ